MGTSWREFQNYAQGFKYRLGAHHRSRHGYEIVKPDGKAISKSGFASAVDARKAAFAHLGRLLEEHRGAA